MEALVDAEFNSVEKPSSDAVGLIFVLTNLEEFLMDVMGLLF